MRRSIGTFLVTSALSLAACASGHEKAPPANIVVPTSLDATSEKPQEPTAREAEDAAPFCPPGSSVKLDRCVPCDGASASEADQKAACAFAEIAKKAALRFDLDGSLDGYRGTIDKVVDAFEADVEQANSFALELEPIAMQRESKHWAVMGRLRQSALYEAIRIRLMASMPPRVGLYSPKEEELLKKAETSGDASLLTVAGQIRARREEQFQAAHAQWMVRVEAPLVHYAVAGLLLAKSGDLHTTEIRRARDRLGTLADALGDQKINEYAAPMLDPSTEKPFAYSSSAFSSL